MMVSSFSAEDLQDKYLKLKQKEKYLEIINAFALAAVDMNTIDEVVWGIAKQVVARMDFEDCIVYLLNEDKTHLIQMAAHGPKNPIDFDIKNPIKIPVGKGIVGTVAITGKPEIINDTRLDPRYIIDDECRLSEIAMPIIYKGDVIGVIDSEHTEAGFYTQGHLSILQTIAAISASKIMYAKADEILKQHQVELERQVDLKTQNLNKAIIKLKKSNQDLESFAYAASHDLQEPLRTITSYLQLIQRRNEKLSKESKEYFEFVISGAKRMKSLLQGLLQYSRLRDFEEKEMSHLDMNYLLDLIQANLHASINTHDAKIIVDKLHDIDGNKTQIIQLFQNIISNALKFKKEDRLPQIEISSYRKESCIEFQILDNGVGIDPSFHEKIFGLFSRLNPIGSFEGHGIGLALCKRIVEYHGGSISVESEIGEGSCFYLRFPFE